MNNNSIYVNEKDIPPEKEEIPYHYANPYDDFNMENWDIPPLYDYGTDESNIYNENENDNSINYSSDLQEEKEPEKSSKNQVSVDVDVVSELVKLAHENKNNLNEEQQNNIDLCSNIIKLDETLTNTINQLFQVKRELREYGDLEGVEFAKENVNDCVKSIKDTRLESRGFLTEIASSIDNKTNDLFTNLAIFNNVSTKKRLTFIGDKLKINIMKLDKSINIFNKMSVNFKTFQRNTSNLYNTLAGKDVNREKVEPSDTLVKRLVSMRDKLMKWEDKNSVKLEKVSKSLEDKISNKVSVLEKIENNKKIIKGENQDVIKENKIEGKQPTFEENCNKLATEIVLFLQSTSHSAGNIEEIKSKLEFGDTDIIKNVLFDATQDKDNYLIKNIDKFEIENYPKELVLNNNNKYLLVQKTKNQVNFKIFDEDLNLINKNTIDTKSNIYKAFSQFTKKDLKDILDSDKDKLGSLGYLGSIGYLEDVDKFKKLVTQNFKQKQQQKVQSNVI